MLQNTAHASKNQGSTGIKLAKKQVEITKNIRILQARFRIVFFTILSPFHVLRTYRRAAGEKKKSQSKCQRVVYPANT